MKPGTGTYAFVLNCPASSSLVVGRLGQVKFDKGFYVYIGSAFGPGGLAARLARHHRTEKARHWHIDYIAELMLPAGTLYSHDSRRLEHGWAAAISRQDCAVPVEGFGSSDCQCQTHMYHVSGSDFRPRRLAKALSAVGPVEVMYQESPEIGTGLTERVSCRARLLRRIIRPEGLS